MKRRQVRTSTPRPGFGTIVATLLLFVAGVTGCSKVDDPNRLPDGKYPITFTAAVDGLTVQKAATRATGKDAWAGNEVVAIQIGSETKRYTVSDAASGSLTPADAANTFYWSNRTMHVAAWFPIDFRVTNIQDQTDADKYRQQDFLYTSQDVVFKADTPLKLKHRMAKVSIELKAGGGLTADNLQNAAVKIYGYTAATVDHATGTVTGSGGSYGWISPLQASNTYTALLVPQTAFPAGEKFISVTIGGNTYYYKPLAGDGDTPAGVESRYTITVINEGLSVAVSRWQLGSEVEGTDNEKPYTITVTGDEVENLILSNNVTSVGNNTFTYSLNQNEAVVLDFKLPAGKGASVDLRGTVNSRMEYDLAGRSFKYTLDVRSDLNIDISLVDYLSTYSVGNYIYPDGTCTAVPLENEAAGIVYKVADGKAHVVAMKSDGEFGGGFEFYDVIKNHTPKINGYEWMVNQQCVIDIFTIQEGNQDAGWRGGWTRLVGNHFYKPDGHAWIHAMSSSSTSAHINLDLGGKAFSRPFCAITIPIPIP